MIRIKIDILYRQLHDIIERHRFSGRLVLAMGSAYNVQLLQRYLSCYSLKIQAVIDNDPGKRGAWCGECRTFLPEEILQPFREKALILIFSPNYAVQMKKQLTDMGYRENTHFFILKDFRQPDDNWGFFFRTLADALKGMRLYREILKKYGKDVHIFIVRGATGDVFLNGLYLDEYVRKRRIRKFVLVGDAKGLGRIAALFGITDTVSLSFEEAEQLQQCYKFFKCNNVTDLFMWQGSLYFNRCQTRMHREFHFLDTYTYYIYGGMVGRQEWKKPVFQPLTEELEERYRQAGLRKGKTIMIAPFAYSVKNLPAWFWEEIADRLREKGYEVFASINTAVEVNPFGNMDSFFFPFEESEAVLQYCGNFIALRSGLCDIVSMVPCRQVILYPEEMEQLDYRVHRSDMKFSGFEVMGFDTGKITEIASTVIRDIVCAEDYKYSETELVARYYELVAEVEKQFPQV